MRQSFKICASTVVWRLRECSPRCSRSFAPACASVITDTVRARRLTRLPAHVHSRRVPMHCPFLEWNVVDQ
eukprot:6197188-Pleurochrysis_carterae.AAC.1